MSLYHDGSADGVILHKNRLHSLQKPHRDAAATLSRTLMDGAVHGGCGTDTEHLSTRRQLEVTRWKVRLLHLVYEWICR